MQDDQALMRLEKEEEKKHGKRLLSEIAIEQVKVAMEYAETNQSCSECKSFKQKEGYMPDGCTLNRGFWFEVNRNGCCAFFKGK